MKNLTLKRIAYTDDGTFGVLLDGEYPFAVTLERPWLDNKRSKSCIPSGQYKATRRESPKFGNTFMVRNVPNRSHILFHKGNLDDDSHGCILVAENYGILHGETAILSSSSGFGEFLAKLHGHDWFNFTVEGEY